MPSYPKSNRSKVILDLCGGTGSWSLPYRKAGYDVRVITLPTHDIMEYKPPDKVYGILAAPPCTHLSLARTTAKTPRDLRGAMELVNRCLHIIYAARYEGTLKFWALENPLGILRQFLGKPPLTWEPFEYGDPYTKKTDLWGYYNLPKRKPVELIDQQMRDCSINNRILPELPKEYAAICPEGKQAARRAMTPKGFATAFYKANK